MKLTVSALNVYPIKSLAGIALSKSEVTSRGLRFDRRWMLINKNGRFLSQREFGEMALLQPEIVDGHMTIRHKANKLAPFTFSMDQYGEEELTVSVWDDTCKALEVSEEASEWFSSALSKECRLVYMPDSSVRPADPDYAISPDDKVSFADGYPILMFDETSLDQLSQKANETIPTNRFRGNIITRGGHPHIEDELKVFEINQGTYYGVKPCSRCIVTTIDQTTGVARGTEPLKTLSRYRKIDHKIKFGQNVIPPSSGTIAVGDTIVVKEMNKPITF